MQHARVAGIVPDDAASRHTEALTLPRIKILQMKKERRHGNIFSSCSARAMSITNQRELKATQQLRFPVLLNH